MRRSTEGSLRTRKACYAQFNTRIKLSVMMGLQFFIWGCWLPLIYGYLHADL